MTSKAARPDPLRFYHRTTDQAARAILSSGFRDSKGTFGTLKEWSGVWISDKPLDANEGADGDVLLAIDLDPSDFSTMVEYEWVEDGKTYREWLIPAVFLNSRGRTSRIEDEEAEPGFSP